MAIQNCLYNIAYPLRSNLSKESTGRVDGFEVLANRYKGGVNLIYASVGALYVMLRENPISVDHEEGNLPKFISWADLKEFGPINLPPRKFTF